MLTIIIVESVYDETVFPLNIIFHHDFLRHELNLSFFVLHIVTFLLRVYFSCEYD